MKRHRLSIACLCLLTIVGATIGVRPVGAHDRILKLHAKAFTGPIGVVRSLGPWAVNGREAAGEQAIWDGDQVRTSRASATVVIDEIGRVELRPGTTARFATGVSDDEENPSRRVLIGELIEGEISVNLEEPALAYIEALGSCLSASSGAAFRLSVRDTELWVDTIRGKLTPTEPRQPPPIIKVKSGPTTTLKEKQKPGQVSGLALTCARVSKPKITQLTSGPVVELVTYRTGQNVEETPLAGRPVRFEVNPSSVGQILDEFGRPIDSKRTDSTGTVRVQFKAGTGEGDIIATVDPDPAQDPPDTEPGRWQQHVVVVSGAPWNWIAAAAGGGAATAIIVTRHRRGIEKVPPTVVSP